VKVIYEDQIIKRIQRAVYDAGRANLRIGYIEVTVREANELGEHIRRSLWVVEGRFDQFYTKEDAGKVIGQFYGAEIRVEMKREPTDACNSRRVAGMI
jgi:hypothetical protein